MPWPLVKLIPQKTKFKFVRFAFFASFASIAAVLASFGSMVTAGYRENPIAMYQEAPGGPAEKIGAILKSYGVAKVSDLPAAKYEAFVTDLSAI